MARPKEFDREVAVEAAKALFWQRGYEATSTEDLRLTMGIGRQSFYDSFGGKRQLFLEVLQRYNAEGVARCVERVQSAASPRDALEQLLLSYSKDKPQQRALGCLGVAAMSELGVSDPDVAAIGSASSKRLEAILEQLVRAAKAKREVRATLNERAVARNLHATIMGMKVMCKAGASAEALRDVAMIAIDGLTTGAQARRPRARS